MKKILAFAILASVSCHLYAQSWMPQHINGPVKLADIVQSYKWQEPTYKTPQKEKDGKEEEESQDYLFRRWVWYWQRHLDTQGYMVPPVRTWNNWNDYLQKQDGLQHKSTGNHSADWTFQGPDTSTDVFGGVGRINAVGFHPTDTNTFIVGSAGGGAWRTTNGGATWSSLYDNLPTLGVSDIDYNPQNPNSIYICTGDGDGKDNFSIGILKSTDGGHTFSSLGPNLQNQLYTANCLAISPTDTNTLLLASSQGIYKSANGGTSWTQEIYGSMQQVVYNTANPNIVYATGYGWNINPAAAEIYRSTDGGDTWNAVTNITSLDRIAIAVTPQNGNIVKAIMSGTNRAFDGIYSSSDGGNTFSEIFAPDPQCINDLLSHGDPQYPECDGQGDYDLCITINPTDTNTIFVGGVNTYRSTNGGYSWALANQWETDIPGGIPLIHADQHFIGYNPAAPGTLYEGCDGGIYKSSDPMHSWADITHGLGITQFYRLAVENDVPYVLGGAQDNGTKMINNGIYIDLTPGDGGQPIIDYADPNNTWYTSLQNGAIFRTINGGQWFDNISDNIPGIPFGAWMTPFVQHPQDHNKLLAGYDKIYYSQDQGNTWTGISPVLIQYNEVSGLAISAKNPNYIYALVNTIENDSALHYTTNFGSTWNGIYNVLYPGYISDIAIDPKNENKLWVTFGAYGSGKVAMYNITTGTWTPEDDSLPDIPVNCIVIDTATQTKYVGTSTAVFYRDTTMSQWELYNTNLPTAEVNDLGINYTTGELWAATFGRGMWKTTKHETPSTGIINVLSDKNAIAIVPNPNTGTFTITTADKGLINKTVSIKLLSGDGKVILQSIHSFDANGKIKINAYGLARGIYVCQIVGDGVAATTKVIIL